MTIEQISYRNYIRKKHRKIPHTKILQKKAQENFPCPRKQRK